jgi:hypothetical protein
MSSGTARPLHMGGGTATGPGLVDQPALRAVLPVPAVPLPSTERPQHRRPSDRLDRVDFLQALQALCLHRRRHLRRIGSGQETHPRPHHLQRLTGIHRSSYGTHLTITSLGIAYGAVRFGGMLSFAFSYRRFGFSTISSKILVTYDILRNLESNMTSPQPIQEHPITPFTTLI